MVKQSMGAYSLLDQQIQTLHRSTEIAGIAVAVIERGQTVYHSGFGHSGNEIITAETSFEVASLSKPLFAYAVLQLCQQGILQLDIPISHYLPTPYVLNEPYLPFITIRHALSHTTGFPNWREEAGLRAAFRPGTKFHYSTEGLIYLQTALEHVIRQPFHIYARENLLIPFGMDNSEFLPIDMDSLPDYLPRHLYSFGAVSLRTTVIDYARFLEEMMARDVSDAFHLSEVLLSEMLTPRIHVGNQEGLFWGLGWGIQQSLDGVNRFWHWGQRRSRTRNFAMGSREEQTGIVILTNHESGLTLCEPIVEMTLRCFGNPAFKWLLPAEKWRADGLSTKAE